MPPYIPYALPIDYLRDDNAFTLCCLWISYASPMEFLCDSCIPLWNSYVSPMNVLCNSFGFAIGYLIKFRLHSCSSVQLSVDHFSLFISLFQLHSYFSFVNWLDHNFTDSFPVAFPVFNCVVIPFVLLFEFHLQGLGWCRIPLSLTGRTAREHAVAKFAAARRI